ncbi:Uncharacterised protein [Serratia rubidaea]|nr:Uncharacterised protein [Serratia rubidaea]
MPLYYPPTYRPSAPMFAGGLIDTLQKQPLV